MSAEEHSPDVPAPAWPGAAGVGGVAGVAPFLPRMLKSAALLPLVPIRVRVTQVKLNGVLSHTK